MTNPTLLFIGSLSAGHQRTPANPLGLHPKWVGPDPDAYEWLLGLCMAGGPEIQDVMLRQPAGNYGGQPVSFSHGPCTCGEARWAILQQVAKTLWGPQLASPMRRLTVYVGGWPVTPCSLVHDETTSFNRTTLPWIEQNLRPWARLGSRIVGVDASSRGQQDRDQFEYVHTWTELNLGIGLQYEAIPGGHGGVVDWDAVVNCAGAMSTMTNFRVRLFGMPPGQNLPWDGTPIPMWKRMAWTVPNGARAIALVAPGDGVTAAEIQTLRDLGYELAWRNAPFTLP